MSRNEEIVVRRIVEVRSEMLDAIRANDVNQYDADIQAMRHTIDELEAENAKLRELVRESLMDYRQYAEKYGLPPYLSDVNEHLDARLRELGIEVDG